MGLISGATGVVALFAPFALGLSPVRVILDPGEATLELAGPLFLAIPIAVWQVLRLAIPLPTRAETILSYILSTISMLPVVHGSVLLFSEHAPQISVIDIAAVIVCCCAAAGNVSLLVRNRHYGLTPCVIAEAYLLLGYLPHAMFLLIMFSWVKNFSSQPSWGWNWGAYIVLATCLLYIAHVVSLLRSGKPASTQSGAEGDTLPAARS